MLNRNKKDDKNTASSKSHTESKANIKVEQTVDIQNTLKEIYPYFHTNLLSGNLESIQEALKKFPQLALYEEKGCMPPVISALHHSFSHQRSIEVLSLLSQYKANFNLEYQVNTFYGVKVNSTLNPIAYLLINGGDYRLIKKLIDCGTNVNHPSISVVLKIIESKQFSETITYKDNPNDRNSLELANIFKEMSNKPKQELSLAHTMLKQSLTKLSQSHSLQPTEKEIDERVNKNGIENALRMAIYKGELESINYLAQRKKANLESRERFSTYTFLMDAIVGFSGNNEVNEKVIACLLQNGSNPNAGLPDSSLIVFGVPLDQGATPLILLICKSTITGFSQKLKNIADLLVEHKADINTLTKSRMTALHYAAKLNCPNWVKYLIEKGATLETENQDGFTPMNMTKNMEIFNILCDARIAARRRKSLLSPNSLQKSTVIIFLDIDGVIFHPRDKDRIAEYLVSRDKELGIDTSRKEYNSQDCDKAAVELFDKAALKNLHALISTIENLYKLVARVVVSSAWREGRSLEELKKILAQNELFEQYDFLTKMIDKTADKIIIEDKEINFGKQLDRGEEIELWLKQNNKHLNISNFLILDDIDTGISELFPNNFVECLNGSFNQKDLEKAFSLLQKEPVSQEKEDYPVNRLNLTITNESKKRKTEGSLRLTVNTRKEFITDFFKSKALLLLQETSDKRNTCAGLIQEYDTGPTKKGSPGCSIM